MKQERDRGYDQSETIPFEPDLEELLEMIGGEQGKICDQIYADHKESIDNMPGSRDAHHAWPGGYKHHVEQTTLYFIDLFDLAEKKGHFNSIPPEERFTAADGMVVMFLHDIEKPFMYDFDYEGNIVPSELANITAKPERKQFRQDLIDRYGLKLTPNQQNALEFVEGVRDDKYVPGQRADKPLAALCHAADNYSARVLYSHRASY